MSTSRNNIPFYYYQATHNALESSILLRAFQEDPTCIPGVSDTNSEEMDRVIELCQSRRAAILDRIQLANNLTNSTFKSSGKSKAELKPIREQFCNNCRDFIQECSEDLPAVYFNELLPLFNALMQMLGDRRRVTALESS